MDHPGIRYLIYILFPIALYKMARYLLGAHSNLAPGPDPGPTEKLIHVKA